MSSEVVIELTNVWKKYSMKGIFHKSLREDISNFFIKRNNGALKQGDFWALKNINLCVKKGELIALYGLNGSGKTTILKLIASVTYPNIGEVKTKGRIAPLLEFGAGFHPDLTGRENIYINSAVIGMTLSETKEKINAIINFSELQRFIDMPVKKYSSGMYVRLSFSIAIHSSAEILLLDEMLAVGDESFQKKCLEKIKEIKEQKRTIVLVSHDLTLIKEIADRIIYLNNGEIKETELNYFL